jgi:hypothetical protein
MSIMPLVMKGYGVISAVDVFEFKEGRVYHFELIGVLARPLALAL